MGLVVRGLTPPWPPLPTHCNQALGPLAAISPLIGCARSSPVQGGTGSRLAVNWPETRASAARLNQGLDELKDEGGEVGNAPLPFSKLEVGRLLCPGGETGRGNPPLAGPGLYNQALAHYLGPGAIKWEETPLARGGPPRDLQEVEGWRVCSGSVRNSLRGSSLSLSTLLV